MMEAVKPGFKKVEKCSENALRSVSELHVGDEKQTGSNKFDMVIIIHSFIYFSLVYVISSDNICTT